MKRLIKKANHDILNRDFAIIYCNGKFYTGITHAYCLNDIKKDNKDLDLILKSYQFRPSYDQFMEISKQVGPVVLAHCAAKEEGVFIDIGFIEGDAILFDEIPNNIKNEFEKEYDMPAYDEMKHDNVNIQDPEQNPYFDEMQQKTKELTDTMKELDKTEEAKEFLENNGYEYDSRIWVYVNDKGVAVDVNEASCVIYTPLQENVECQSEVIENAIKGINNPIEDVLDEYVGKDNYSIIFRNFLGPKGMYEISFENNYNQAVYLKSMGYRLDIFVDGINIISEIEDYCPDGEFNYMRDMKLLMDFKVDEEEEEEEEHEMGQNYNNNNSDDDFGDLDDLDLDLDDFDFDLDSNLNDLDLD